MTPRPATLFGALEGAEPLLIDALSHLGVDHTEYVVGFSRPFTLSVWLGTASDAQRDAIGTRDPLLQLIERILDNAGAPRDLMGTVGSTAQSQETVDRDYDGSWFYVLR